MNDVFSGVVTNGIVRNVALNKTSWQISTLKDEFGEHSANLANDGSRQTRLDVRNNGCAASQPATDPWWAVDLEKPADVRRVQLTNPDSYGSSIVVFLRRLCVPSVHSYTLNFYSIQLYTSTAQES